MRRGFPSFFAVDVTGMYAGHSIIGTPVSKCRASEGYRYWAAGDSGIRRAIGPGLAGGSGAASGHRPHGAGFTRPD